MDYEYFQYFPRLEDFEENGIFFDEALISDKILKECIEPCYQSLDEKKLKKILFDFIISIFGVYRVHNCFSNQSFILQKTKNLSERQLKMIKKYFEDNHRIIEYFDVEQCNTEFSSIKL